MKIMINIPGRIQHTKYVFRHMAIKEIGFIILIFS